MHYNADTKNGFSHCVRTKSLLQTPASHWHGGHDGDTNIAGQTSWDAQEGCEGVGRAQNRNEMLKAMLRFRGRQYSGLCVSALVVIVLRRSPFETWVFPASCQAWFEVSINLDNSATEQTPWTLAPSFCPGDEASAGCLAI